MIDGMFMSRRMWVQSSKARKGEVRDHPDGKRFDSIRRDLPVCRLGGSEHHSFIKRNTEFKKAVMPQVLR